MNNLMNEKRKLELNVDINENTWKKLRNNGFHLIVFRGTACDTDAGLSTVWIDISNENLEEQINISWNDNYEVFRSSSVVKDGAVIRASTKRDIDLGEVFHIKADKSIEVESDGEEGILTIMNDYTSVTVGYSMKKAGEQSFNPVYAREIPGNSTAKFTPKNKLLVAFTTDKDPQSSCVTKITTAAAIIEYDDQIDSHSITFDYDSGVWEKSPCDRKDLLGTNFAWFTFIKAGVNIVNNLLNG